MAMANNNAKTTTTTTTDNRDKQLADMVAQLAQLKADLAAAQAAKGKSGPQTGTCLGYKPAAVLRHLGRRKVGLAACKYVMDQLGFTTLSGHTLSTQYGLGAAGITAKNRAKDSQIPNWVNDGPALSDPAKYAAYKVQLDGLLAKAPKGNGNAQHVADLLGKLAALQADLQAAKYRDKDGNKQAS